MSKSTITEKMKHHPRGIKQRRKREQMEIEKLLLKEPQKFSSEQLKTFTKEFSLRLGSGGFGDVYKGILRKDVKVAVKVLRSNLLSEVIKNQFLAEVGTLVNTRHKNIVGLWGFCFEEEMKAIVYEFMEKESLYELLHGDQSIAWETLCMIATGTAEGLSYLHGQGIIHYDVKPCNILLDSNFIPKVGDFGLAKFLGQDKTHITQSGIRGTRGYIAPEFNTHNSEITPKCDVYSYGMTLFDILGREKHLLNASGDWFPSQVWKKFSEGHQEEVMEECYIQEKNREQATRILLIALHCVQYWPAARPSMSDVVRLLEGAEEIKLPNHPEFGGSSSGTQVESSTPKDLRLEKCIRIGAKELTIEHNDPEHWRWTSDAQSRFPEVAELLYVYWLKIKGTIHTHSLSPETTYMVYFVFKFAARTRGFDLPAAVTVKFAGQKSSTHETRKVYLDPRGNGRSRIPSHNFLGHMRRAFDRIIRQMIFSVKKTLHKDQYPRERGDGWTEVEMGKFDNYDEEDRKVKMYLRKHNDEELEIKKSGLIVGCIELRPKVVGSWWYLWLMCSVSFLFVAIVFHFFHLGGMHFRPSGFFEISNS